MQPEEIALVAAAGAAAGVVNAVAGAGSLLTFPALLAVGFSPVTANVTNAVAVLPGYLGGSLAYRRELRGQAPRIRTLGSVTAAGAIVGAALLLTLPARAFELVAPALIALASLMLAAQPRLAARLSARSRATPGRGPLLLAAFACAIYGGYFGAGLGLLLLAVLGLLLPDDLQRINALKGVLSLVAGAVAAVVFALFGPVAWDAAAVGAAASFAGGHAGVSVARRLDPDRLRQAIAALGLLVALVLLLA